MKQVKDKKFRLQKPLRVCVSKTNGLEIKKPCPLDRVFFVPRVGIEPTLPKELDFESSASTSSATEALLEHKNKQIIFTR